MKKSLFAILLAVALVIGLVPTAALDVAAEGTEVTLVENFDGSSYTDTTAEPGQAYVYTVTGSDGSTYEVEVLPDGITSETVTTSIYELVSVDSLDKIENGTYMIVNSRWHRALLPTSNFNSTRLDRIAVGTVIASEDYESEEPDATITLDSSYDSYALDWEITSTGTSDSYTIKNVSTGGYLVIGSDTAGTQENAVSTTIALFSNSSESHAGSITLSQGGEYLNMHGGYEGYFAGYEEAGDGGAAIYLYLKHPAGTTYTVDTSALQTLVDTYEKKGLISTNYSNDSWDAYSDALGAANDLLEQSKSFTTLEAATAFQATLNTAKATLEAAYSGLVQLETITIRPTWQRTLESNTTDYEEEATVSALIKGVEYITRADDTDAYYSIITWKDKAKEILALTTDPTMTVWDYNTDAQYASENKAGKVTGVSAATWNEHEETSGEWTKASVRRFTGTFTWPEGYDVDDAVVYQSVNDANYSAIYEYINNDATLKARYGDSKVYPINDDMFVFIRKATETLTVDDYLNHMLFWSGTSGKGLWSTAVDNGSGDWDRTVPATFNGKNALPAYHGIMPNTNDVTGTQATIDGLDINTMKHTDYWYTMINSNTVMSTVKNLYGVEDLSNQTMIIDIFCFDNSEIGGMDEIELVFQKTPETETTVQVNYYLDSVLAANLLGSTVMTGVADETQITLHAGTNVNELDYYRFAAATKAGTVVSNGMQQAPVPYTVDVDLENNIINVVYTSGDATDRVYYFYDFGVENTYIYTPKEDAVLNKDYTITAVSNTNPNIKPSISSDKKNVILSYTPTSSLGEMVVGTLNITFDGSYGTEVKPIVIAPASNVLFEENFMKQKTTTSYADWSKAGTVDTSTVSDNETTVFGYTTSYNTSTGESGVYTATVNDATKFTDNLQFQFGGTGFDLIGTCGPNTGTIAVKVVNSAGESVKNYLVDTSFTDTTNVVAEGTTIYQVPLIQAKDLPEDTYTVTIRGAYIVYNTTSAASTYSLYGTESTSGSDPITDIYDLLYGVGMTEDDIDCVEYINMGKLMGASTYAVTDESTDTAAETTTIPTEMTIGIDGFRSYRATDYNKYPTTELGVTYKNILDCVSDRFAAYIETAENDTYIVNEYELSGGPQNEIYLTNTNGALAIAGSDVAKQISLRSVDGNPVTVKINGSTSLVIEHTTEMYYAVEENESGYVIIQVESGFLGIGNLKLTSGDANTAAVMTTSLTEDDYALVATTMRLYAATPAEPVVFEPEKFEVTTKTQRNNYTVTIIASSDVDYITVNGEVITKARTKRGSDEKVFTYRGRLGKNETTALEIIAFDADGVASDLVTTEIESKPQRKMFSMRGGVR